MYIDKRILVFPQGRVVQMMDRFASLSCIARQRGLSNGCLFRSVGILLGSAELLFSHRGDTVSSGDIVGSGI